MEDLGYCMEKLILELVSMGLGTCWMAGTFRRSSFAAQMDLEEGELLPAISPVGYPADRASLTERVMRYGVRADRRKPFEELFLEADGSPLTREAAGLYWDALEAVRLGPSASNRQPWRMLRDEGGVSISFSRKTRATTGPRAEFGSRILIWGLPCATLSWRRGSWA